MLSIRKFTKGLCGVLLAIWLGAPLLPAQEQQDNFLIIRAFSGPTLINSGLEAFYQNDHLFIPVTYFADDLDVPISYDEENHRLTGWVVIYFIILNRMKQEKFNGGLILYRAQNNHTQYKHPTCC